MAQTFGDIGAAPGEGANEFLDKLVKELEENPPTDTNQGHLKLMTDLSELAYEAHHYEFHDYKNTKYPTPKVELRNRLLALAQAVVDGKYDND